MEMTANLVQLLPMQTGQGKNGQWKKQEFIVETEGTYPKKVCVEVWGDKINESVLRPGNKVKLSFDVESREYNGRWYTSVKAWKVELADGASSSNSGMPPQQAPQEYFGTIDRPAADNSAGYDDLPF